MRLAGKRRESGRPKPSVGAWFKGYNQLGRLRFAAKCEVVTADEGREFAFRRTAPGQRGEVIWRYRLEPDATGTRVVESYEVVRHHRDRWSGS